MGLAASFLSNVPDWAIAEEHIISGEQGAYSFTFSVLEEDKFLIVALSSLDGDYAPKEAKFRLSGPNGYSLEPVNDDTAFISTNGQVAVYNSPSAGVWQIDYEYLPDPYSIHIMTFHPSPTAMGGLLSRHKCSICKTTTKALALAIFAGLAVYGSATALPAALLAAVAQYLGLVVSAAVTAFINSLTNDAVDTIARKLCERVNLCRTAGQGLSSSV